MVVVYGTSGSSEKPSCWYHRELGRSTALGYISPPLMHMWTYCCVFVFVQMKAGQKLIQADVAHPGLTVTCVCGGSRVNGFESYLLLHIPYNNSTKAKERLRHRKKNKFLEVLSAKMDLCMRENRSLGADSSTRRETRTFIRDMFQTFKRRIITTLNQ